MTTDVVRVTSKGQATIPVELRQKYGIRAPGLVRFVERRGQIVVEPIASADQVFGSLRDAFSGVSAKALVLQERQADKAREARRFR